MLRLSPQELNWLACAAAGSGTKPGTLASLDRLEEDDHLEARVAALGWEVQECKQKVR